MSETQSRRSTRHRLGYVAPRKRLHIVTGKGGTGKTTLAASLAMIQYFNYLSGLTMTNGRFADLFGGPPRKPESEITQRELDLAASIQVVTEDIEEYDRFLRYKLLDNEFVTDVQSRIVVSTVKDTPALPIDEP